MWLILRSLDVVRIVGKKKELSMSFEKNCEHDCVYLGNGDERLLYKYIFGVVLF